MLHDEAEAEKGYIEVDKLSQCYLTVRIVSWFVCPGMVENRHISTLIGSCWNTNTCSIHHSLSRVIRNQRSYVTKEHMYYTSIMPDVRSTL